VNSLRFPANWSEDDHARYSAERERLSHARMAPEFVAKVATVAGGDPPLELLPPLPRAQPYPTDALGPLRKPAEAIAKKCQAPLAMAAQSVLAVAALAGQAHADVVLPYGQSRPLSLFLVSVAGSGERKSTTDNESNWPVAERENVLRDEHRDGMACWKIEHSAWTAQRRQIEGDRKKDLAEKREALRALGLEPPQPLAPFLTTGDLTIEGLAKIWPHAHPSLGVFTAEGGMFTGGHGMTEENRLRTAAALSELWDGKPTKRLRALDGATILPGRRLSMHLMVQPDAAANFLANGTLRDQGLLSRMLVAAPESIAGTRFYRDTHPDDEAEIRTFGARILSILETPTALAHGTRNELAPRRIPMSAIAERYWKACHDNIERQSGMGGELANISDFAAKAPEHAARIAAVLAIFNDVTAANVCAECMEGGIRLVEWYIGEALRLTRAARTDPRLLRAAALLDWLRARPEDSFQLRDVLRLGPAPLRTKAMAEDAIRILIEHRWSSEASKRPRVLILHRAA